MPTITFSASNNSAMLQMTNNDSRRFDEVGKEYARRWKE